MIQINAKIVTAIAQCNTKYYNRNHTNHTGYVLPLLLHCKYLGSYSDPFAHSVTTKYLKNYKFLTVNQTTKQYKILKYLI